ncbi:MULTISPECIES: hypothetical protein [Agathobacter]|uniref:Uncharacterized protein n=1 Tax=Agathobacter ruminis TaxID=1712665 RepID=A0A2G3E4M7_9FIRM|nr:MULTISPECIES: hypothetical protein [Agathobacter]MBQ1681338.1 hypothetical protein [Agathobacter sp.]MDC7301810.1 hypothetical protein [Agathobacter ruminis]PHU38023.1 hypothetical protein CSX02_04930 [Agathobacter ruminis]
MQMITTVAAATHDTRVIPLLILLLLVGVGIILAGLLVKRTEDEDKKNSTQSEKSPTSKR